MRRAAERQARWAAEARTRQPCSRRTGSIFGPVGRAVFRAAVDVDDGTWKRARGYALH
jgi:hypothetical protein